MEGMLNCKLISLSAMPAYKNKCHEWLSGVTTSKMGDKSIFY